MSQTIKITNQDSSLLENRELPANYTGRQTARTHLCEDSNQPIRQAISTTECQQYSFIENGYSDPNF